MIIELMTTATGAFLYDAACFGHFAQHIPNEEIPNEEIFDREYWEAQKKIVARAGGRGTALFIRDERRYWVLRHYCRGGLVAKLLTDHYLWRSAERTRAFREFRLLHRLRAQGFAVPTPVAARYQRYGLWYRADLITEALPATRTLADTISGAVLLDDVWQKIGVAIAKLHLAGVHHVDLNANNILLGENASVWILDFDRGCIRERGDWEAKVLARLKRSLVKIQRAQPQLKFTERDWQALLEGYEIGVKRQT